MTTPQESTAQNPELSISEDFSVYRGTLYIGWLNTTADIPQALIITFFPEE